MAKKFLPTPSLVDDGPVEYMVSPGVTHVNGAKVSSQTVRLTPEQALYDLAVGRLSLPPERRSSSEGV
jgi:hypothetical protein